MKGNFFKKVESLYENNQRLKEFLEQELEELEKLLKLDSFDEDDMEHFTNIQYSLEQIKNNLLNIDSENVLSHIEQPIAFGMLYPMKKEKLFLQLVSLLKEISQEYKIDIVLFPIEEVNLEEKTVNGTIISGTKVNRGVTYIPRFIYNVTFHSQSKSIKTMRKLRRLEKVTIINPINRFNLGILFDMFSSLFTEDKFLLNYDVFSPKTVSDFLNMYNGCIIMPEKGSGKEQIYWVSPKPGSKNIYLVSSTKRSFESSSDEIFSKLITRIKSKRYMVLQPIEALEWMDTPLELRIYLQKNKDGEWSITDMVGKSEFLSKKATIKHVAENLHWTFQELAINNPEKVLQELSDLSLDCCRLLDYYIPNLGTCTLDFILDQNNRPYLFYVKGWETRGYLYASSKVDWKAYLLNAFHYLYYLSKNQENKEDAMYDLGKDKEEK